MNYLKTTFLLTLMTGLLIGIGALIGGRVDKVYQPENDEVVFE